MNNEIYNGKDHEQHKPNHELESDNKEKQQNLVEKGQEAARKHAEDKAELLDELRQEVQEEAQSAETVVNEQKELDQPEPPSMLIGKDLKNTKYKQTLRSIQKRESLPERALSKIIHNPAVDAVSAAAEKTVARPISLLTGSVFAFVGSSVFLYVSKHYGYEYNFLLFFIMFIAGFAVGLLLELALRLVRRSAKN